MAAKEALINCLPRALLPFNPPLCLFHSMRQFKTDIKIFQHLGEKRPQRKTVKFNQETLEFKENKVETKTACRGSYRSFWNRKIPFLEN